MRIKITSTHIDIWIYAERYGTTMIKL